MTVQCCKCKRVRAGGVWMRIPTPQPGPVSHSYCPVCEEECYIELFSHQASRSPAFEQLLALTQLVAH